MRLGAGVVTFDQVFEVVVMALGVVARVHGHKAGMLQKARVNATPGTRKIGGHPVNHIVFKPLKALVHGQVVDRGGRLARINGAAHHGHAQRGGLAPAGHERDSRQHGYGGLAHTHDVAIAVNALQVANEFLHVVDVVVEVEFTFRQRYQAGVFPVGDVDLVVLEHGFNGVAQQGGVVAGQGRHNQHGRLGLEFFQGGGVVAETLETAQLTKWLVDFNALVNGNVDAVHINGAQAKLWLFVVFSQTVHQVVAGGNTLRKRVLPQHRQRVAVDFGSRLSQVGERLHE